MFKKTILFLVILILQNNFCYANSGSDQELIEAIGDREDVDHEASLVIIQALNKITAKVKEIRLKIGHNTSFDNIEIIAKRCWKSLPDEKPENKVLLEIFEHGNNKNKRKVFYGWMFSSNPALSSLEHPVYDIMIIDCKKL